MSLIAHGTGTAESPTAAVSNNGFWPDLDPDDFRANHRLDGTITAARLASALRAGMTTVNRVLRHWQEQQLDAGHLTVDVVPLPIWQAPEVYQGLYRRAVYAMAHADLIERYADYDATNSARERGLELEDPADSYRRDASWAISEIQDRPHSTVELI